MKKMTLKLAVILSILLLISIAFGCVAPVRSPKPPPTLAPVPTIPSAHRQYLPDCRLCHETGIGEATVIPEDHSERTSGDCIACHEWEKP